MYESLIIQRKSESVNTVYITSMTGDTSQSRQGGRDGDCQAPAPAPDRRGAEAIVDSRAQTVRSGAT